jgi:hypothetical protein
MQGDSNSGLLDQTDPFGFGLNVADGQSRGIEEGTKHIGRRFLARKVSVLDQWVNGSLEIVVRGRSLQNAKVGDFVFHRIENHRFEKFDRSSKGGPAESAGGNGLCDKSEQRMFAQIAQVIEDPKGITLAAGVWLERPQERLDFRRAVLAETLDSVVQKLWGADEGKVAKFQIGVPGTSVGGRPSGVVEASSSVFDDFSGQNPPPEWESFSEAEFVDFVRAIRIRIADASVWLLTGKLGYAGFEIVEMFLCPCKTAFGAVKDAIGSENRHGQSQI